MNTNNTQQIKKDKDDGSNVSLSGDTKQSWGLTNKEEHMPMGVVIFMERIFGEIKMNYNLLMREVPNGCIIIDARPSSQNLWRRAFIGLQTYATNQVIVLNSTSSL